MSQESIIRDLIVESRKTKTAFTVRCKELDVSPELMAEDCGLSRSDFYAWLEGTFIPKQSIVIKMLKRAGIDVRVDLVFNPINEVSEWKKQ